ncbi:heterokaryon incompatibility protein-domain-containing protein [Phaeosphaeria sp. MPI-PUGE-AT-0046c]|nr:heterokaryon incompatibility protein-domain-containing protein [Phaeosphaeria sp. MPI-PUGE-AT-0046c]
MSHISIYEQRILSGRIFRLLLIHPAQHYDEQLKCSCLPFTIDNAPSFEALSYVWGCPTPAVEVLCNGLPFSIQPALANALSRVRLQHTTRVVWADAICINQKDFAERNHQVTLMGSIYLSATKVIVWLGIADAEHTKRALEVVDRIGSGSDPSIEVFTPEVCASLVELFDRPWFKRIWCVQEIQLARDALVLCGQYEVSGEKLRRAASWIFDKTSGIKADEQLTTLLRSVDIGPSDIMFQKQEGDLLWTLQSVCEFKSSDPKDKVYGILSLVSPREEAQAIDIDYGKSVGAVYADTVMAVIQLHSKLSALAFVSHPPDYDGLDEYRSWAPRWDNETPAFAFGFPERSNQWNAGGRDLVSLTEEIQAIPGALHLKGVIFDTVLEVYEVVMDIETGAQENVIHPFLEIYNEICCGPNAQDREQILARTVAAGTYNDKNLEDLDAAMRDRYYLAFERVMLRLAQLEYKGTEGDCGHDIDSKIFEALAYQCCKQRRFFWTREGSLGLGPQCMRVEDVVVVLYGGNTPYVLRPRGDRFLFLGQAYIDNIMHGEIMIDLHAGMKQEQTFCLI